MRSIRDYHLLAETLYNTMISSIRWDCEPSLDLIFKKHPQLIVTLNHSTPISWAPAVTALICESMKAQGESRIPRGIMDRWFFQNPITAPLAQMIAQSKHPLTFEELKSDFHEGKINDLVLFPEGAFTFFGDSIEIKNFRSLKFLELAITCNVPLLVVIHKGSEHWGIPLTLPQELGDLIKPFAPFFGRNIASGLPLNLPIPLSKISHFEVKVRIWHPGLKSRDLSADPVRKKKQLQHQAKKLRIFMLSLLGVMDSGLEFVEMPESPKQSPRQEVSL